MHTLESSEISRIGGGALTVGDTYTDLNGGTFTDLNKHYGGLYVAIGGHWVPTGTEPFIGPGKIPAVN
ncbi:hypothetical protein [Cognatazoarcus halotolerans]|uniref:hypothetical protein n=1 Tax=Cognatazoarcus halotolerans TaxID=2686016 RepID=UPI00135AD527|nr:hypothetical protein [Cognatazoarcus halotolerans]MCB1901767.1 hypothetical protein [Rhodocyclaceae bacterium]MCP5308234.1 hypothetical protein [Zoogloeaceae bacterium]MCP5360916.1 hypothetical protein [Nevskiaceae bacterium]